MTKRAWLFFPLLLLVLGVTTSPVGFYFCRTCNGTVTVVKTAFL
jgi:hypothetical protein